MARDVQTILKLNVPVIVRLGHRRMMLQEVLRFAPGTIIELPKNAEEPLDLMVNNKVIGKGNAVKIGENFGLAITTIGEPKQRIAAMSGGSGREDEK